MLFVDHTKNAQLSIFPGAVLDVASIEDMLSQVAAFVARRWRVPADRCHVTLEAMCGGLESIVMRARIACPGTHGEVPPELIVKQLPTGLEREADVYELLWRHLDSPPAVQLLGREAAGGATYLYLEQARAASAWPWTNTALAASVCRALARFHDGPVLPRAPFAWDYEAELTRSAASTLDLARAARDGSGRRCWSRLGDLRRVVAALPRIRDRILGKDTAVIHGDMHPGNVFLRGTTSRDVLLIDWARARLGSPFEDVASWLHSLGCWEPEARRRHDTLMRAYLEARHTPRRFSADLRRDYWLASASNGLSGAIRYHLAVLGDSHRSEQARADSGRALLAWQRVIRRAAAVLSTTPDRRS